MMFPDAHSHVATTASLSAPKNGAKQSVCKKLFNIQEIEGLFPTYFTATSPHCAICLAEIQASEPCRKTTCRHEFHADCIMKWWTTETGKTLICPACRDAQIVSVSKVKQVIIDTRQRECSSPTGQRQSQSQLLQPRQEETQGPLESLFESVRLVLPRPFGTTSHERNTTERPSQEDDRAIQQPISEEDGTGQCMRWFPL